MTVDETPLRPIRWGRAALLTLIYAAILYVLFRTDEQSQPWFLNLLHGMRESDSPAWRALCRRLSSESIWRPLNVWGEFLTLVLIGVAVWVLDPRHRRRLIVLIVGVVTACALGGVAAGLIGRIRPAKSVGKPEKFFAFGEGMRKLRDTSFPSGHATAAAALATFLALSYPRLRGLAVFLAVGCALARVRFGKHFFSDVFAGLLWGHYAMVWTWRLLAARLTTAPEAEPAPPLAGPPVEAPAEPPPPPARARPDGVGDDIRDALNRRFDKARWEVSVRRLAE